MKTRKIYIFMALLSVCYLPVFSQNTFTNDFHLNNSSDVIGSSRYVGMGGAMGALGADISVMSWNPAGIGLYRKSDIGITFGGMWNKSGIGEENRGSATLDQFGFVYSIDLGNRKCPYFNIGFNYQKKVNYNYNFYADNPALGGLSQMDQIAELAAAGFDTDYNLTGYSMDNGFLIQVPIYEDGDPSKEVVGYDYYNQFGGERNEYTHHSSGSLQGFDLNFSTNINNRAFLGLTIGADNLRYRGWSRYYEESMYKDDMGNEVYGDYYLNNDYHINGYGINVKFGTIIRPIETSPFRFAFVVETPTWYRLKNSTIFNLEYLGGKEPIFYDYVESYLEYIVRTPWKVRFGFGSTVGNKFAWDVDYEFANYKGTKMGYPDYDEYDFYGNSFSNTRDKAMNEHTKHTLQGVSTLRAGLEYKPIPSLALRMGYNYTTPSYKDHVTFDQYSLNSAAMDFATGTSYMRTGSTNIMTLGVGYNYKSFYVDLAYKVRNQNADFYAFDTSFTATGSPFAKAYPELENATIRPVDVNLTRQTIVCSLGFKF